MMANKFDRQQMVKIYGLIAPPVYPDVRYVGVTKNPLSRRLGQHISKAKSNPKTHKDRWILKAISEGMTIQAVLIEEVPADEWQKWEMHYIASFPNLTNSTAGGEGLLNPSAETRAIKRAQNLGKKLSEETKRKIGEKHKGNKHSLGVIPSEATRRKISAAHTGMKRPPRTAETCAKMSQAKKGKTHSEETKQKMSAAHKGKCKSQESIQNWRESRAGWGHSAETKLLMAQRKIGFKHSDATKAKMSESRRAENLSEETRRRLSESTRLAWQKRKSSVRAKDKIEMSA